MGPGSWKKDERPSTEKKVVDPGLQSVLIAQNEQPEKADRAEHSAGRHPARRPRKQTPQHQTDHKAWKGDPIQERPDGSGGIDPSHLRKR